MDCVNLKERFGRTYRVEYEESYYAQYGPHARMEDPWLMIVPCRAGHIFPHGGSLLAASTNKAGPTARKLMVLHGATVHQDGGDGVTVLFDAADFATVAKIMRPKRRRQLTDEQRAAATARLAKFAFSAARQNAGGGQIGVAAAAMV